VALAAYLVGKRLGALAVAAWIRTFAPAAASLAAT